MSKTKWTPAQAAAIQHRGSSLLVTAAAGSGKTAVLAERVVRLLADREHPIQADRLLIVTFTNAAAAELRGRIARELDAALKEEIQSGGKASPAVAWLHAQKVKLQRASICTVDAFCLSLLQKHFAALDIPPDFTTADEGTVFRLRQESLAAVMEKACQDQDFCAFADLYGRSRSDAKAGEIILQLYDFLRSLPAPKAALERFCQMWETDCPLESTPWSRVLSAEALEKVRAMLELARVAEEMALQTETGADKYAPALGRDIAALEALALSLEALVLRPEDAGPTSGEWDRICERLAAWKWDKLGTIRGEKAPSEQTAADLRGHYKNALKKLKENIFICTAEEFGSDRRAAAPLVRALARAVLDFEKTFFEAKCAEKVLEFSDFEHLALRLLQDENGQPSPVSAAIAGSYDVVMVDEYQDTNALQDAIYTRLSGAGDNRFLVGDLKQSIYRFRQADPEVFTEKLLHWPLATPGETPPKGNISIALDANFRSAPAVVEGINYIFENLMSFALGGIDYTGGQRLRSGAVMPKDEKGEPYTGFCEVDTVEEGSDAVFIARRIRELVEQGHPVRDGDALRPCTYGDFCILLRVRSGFGEYSAALEKAGVPVYADVAENLLDAPQIRPLISLLQIIDNPAQDIALASVMLSPLFGFTPDDLLSLRAERRTGSLYGALAASREEKRKAFCEELEALRRLARTLTVSELLEEILARTGYLAAVGAMPGGTMRQEGVRTFVGWAGKAGQGGLATLLRNVEAVSRLGGISSGDRGQTQAGCVSIMTVHRSKGLEFPIVFVAGCGHKFNLQDTSGPVLLHRELGLGLNLRPRGGAGIYKTLQHAAVSQKLRAESLSEEMRVLYVALTRARDGLVIMLPTEGEETLRKAALDCVTPAVCQNALKSGQSWASWLLSAAILHPDAGCLREAAALPLQPNRSESRITFSRLSGEVSAEPERPSGSLPSAPPDEGLLAALAEKFAWRDGRRALRTVPAKVSVTAVVHGQEETVLQRPAFMYKDGLTGAERGTAVHAFLQAADMAAAAADLEGEIARQKELLLLAPELAEKLDKTMLHRFFASEVYRRMTLADTVLREYAFITSLPAKAAVADKSIDYGDASTLVQGVADLVLLFGDHAEIVDYKTDRGLSEKELAERYGAQLQLYRYALKKRLPVPITKLTLFSLVLGREVDIPLKKV